VGKGKKGGRDRRYQRPLQSSPQLELKKIPEAGEGGELRVAKLAPRNSVFYSYFIFLTFLSNL